MRLPWWPIYVQADIEPDGVRVLGDQGGELLYADELLPWTRVSLASMACPLNADGQCLKLNKRKLVFQLKSIRNPGATSAQRKFKEARRKWFANRENQFEINTLPMGKRRAALNCVMIELIIALYAFVIGVFILLPALNRPTPQARAFNFWMGVSVLVVVFALLMKIAFRLLAMKNRTWMVSATQQGAELCSVEQSKFVPWSSFRSVQTNSLLYKAITNDFEEVFIAPGICVKSILESRVPIEFPKLLTRGFVIIGVLAWFSGPMVLWCFQWLQVPLTQISWLAISVVCVLMWGMLILHYYMSRREHKTTDEINSSYSQ